MQCWVCALFLPEVRLQLAAVTLAEELNFTRAAERLRITQPALSKQISELESQIGFVGFMRNQRHVELTEAGQVFIRGCRYALAISKKAIRLAKSTHDDVEPLITIGHSPYIDPSKSIRCGTEMLRGSLSQPFQFERAAGGSNLAGVIARALAQYVLFTQINGEKTSNSRIIGCR